MVSSTSAAQGVEAQIGASVFCLLNHCITNGSETLIPREGRASVTSATSVPSGLDFPFLPVSASLW